MTDEISVRGIKEAFERVKKDIFSLGNELSQIKNELFELKTAVSILGKAIQDFKMQEIEKIASNAVFGQPQFYPADELQIPAYPAIPTDIPTHPQEIGGLNSQNLGISTGNEGVPTDRQTDQQTDNYAPKSLKSSLKTPKPLAHDFFEASKILASLDSLKKEIRLKFKQMTQQEMFVFSTIYQFEQTDPEGADYRKIALKLGLSESSIRDYVQKIINKGIPITKSRLNNKKILLGISKELKEIASLETIIKLREL